MPSQTPPSVCSNSPVGYVHSLESFGSVDGPGVRYVIFSSGCTMRCQFCHNPDTWKIGSGTPYEADTLLRQALRYRTYWGEKGGITVSGGEPLLQIEFSDRSVSKSKAKRRTHDARYERRTLHRRRSVLFQVSRIDEIHGSCHARYQADR